MAGTDEGVREVKRLIERLMIRELDNQGLSGANSTAGQTGTTGPAKVEYVEEQAGNPFPRPPAVRYKPGRYFDTRYLVHGRQGRRNFGPADCGGASQESKFVEAQVLEGVGAGVHLCSYDVFISLRPMEVLGRNRFK